MRVGLCLTLPVRRRTMVGCSITTFAGCRQLLATRVQAAYDKAHEMMGAFVDLGDQLVRFRHFNLSTIQSRIEAGRLDLNELTQELRTLSKHALQVARTNAVHPMGVVTLLVRQVKDELADACEALTAKVTNMLVTKSTEVREEAAGKVERAIEVVSKSAVDVAEFAQQVSVLEKLRVEDEPVIAMHVAQLTKLHSTLESEFKVHVNPVERHLLRTLKSRVTELLVREVHVCVCGCMAVCGCVGGCACVAVPFHDGIWYWGGRFSSGRGRSVWLPWGRGSGLNWRLHRSTSW